MKNANTQRAHHFDLMISKLSKINYAESELNKKKKKLINYSNSVNAEAQQATNEQCRFMAPFSGKPEPTAMDHGNWEM